MNGTVSNVVITKKFGFISGNNGQEYFFHMSDVDTGWDELVYDWSFPGGKVQVNFEPISTAKGPRAKNVRVSNEKV